MTTLTVATARQAAATLGSHWEEADLEVEMSVTAPEGATAPAGAQASSWVEAAMSQARGCGLDCARLWCQAVAPTTPEAP